MGLSITKLALALVISIAATTTQAAPALEPRTLTRADEYLTSNW